MLSERRHQILVRAMYVEMIQLWGFAIQPAHRLPESIIHQRMQDYFAQQLWQAWASADNATLAEALIEIYLVTTGEDPVEGWDPPVLCRGAELLKPL